MQTNCLREPAKLCTFKWRANEVVSRLTVSPLSTPQEVDATLGEWNQLIKQIAVECFGLAQQKGQSKWISDDTLTLVSCIPLSGETSSKRLCQRRSFSLPFYGRAGVGQSRMMFLVMLFVMSLPIFPFDLTTLFRIGTAVWSCSNVLRLVLFVVIVLFIIITLLILLLIMPIEATFVCRLVLFAN